jgi:hypothetical protein
VELDDVELDDVELDDVELDDVELDDVELDDTGPLPPDCPAPDPLTAGAVIIVVAFIPVNPSASSTGVPPGRVITVPALSPSLTPSSPDDTNFHMPTPKAAATTRTETAAHTTPLRNQGTPPPDSEAASACTVAGTAARKAAQSVAQTTAVTLSSLPAFNAARQTAWAASDGSFVFEAVARIALALRTE